jgi:hypothetical protein
MIDHHIMIKKQKMVIDLLNVGTDCLSIILSFLETPEWIQLSYTCRTINQFKYDMSLMKDNLERLYAIWTLKYSLDY